MTTIDNLSRPPRVSAVMLSPLCGRSIPAVCRWMLSAKDNCRDPSPAGKHGGLRMTDDSNFGIQVQST